MPLTPAFQDHKVVTHRNFGHVSDIFEFKFHFFTGGNGEFLDDQTASSRYQ